MPEQQYFVSQIQLNTNTPKAYYCKETKKLVSHVCHLASAEKTPEVSLFCTSSLAISAIRRSKNEKFFCTRHQEKERAGVSTAAATLHYGLKLVGGVVRKIGNCFGGASPSEAAETVAAALRLLHFFLVERGRKDNTRLIGTLRA